MIYRGLLCAIMRGNQCDEFCIDKKVLFFSKTDSYFYSELSLYHQQPAKYSASWQLQRNHFVGSNSYFTPPPHFLSLGLPLVITFGYEVAFENFRGQYISPKIVVKNLGWTLYVKNAPLFPFRKINLSGIHCC